MLGSEIFIKYRLTTQKKLERMINQEINMESLPGCKVNHIKNRSSVLLNEEGK